MLLWGLFGEMARQDLTQVERELFTFDGQERTVSPTLVRRIYNLLVTSDGSRLQKVCGGVGARHGSQGSQDKKSKLGYQNIRRNNLKMNSYPFQEGDAPKSLFKRRYDLGEMVTGGQRLSVRKALRHYDGRYVVEYSIEDDASQKGMSWRGSLNWTWGRLEESEQDFPEPVNCHRKIDEGLRGRGIGDILFLLSEEALAEMGFNQIAVLTAQPGIISWLFNRGYVPKIPQEFSYEALEAVLQNNEEYGSVLGEPRIPLVKVLRSEAL